MSDRERKAAYETLFPRMLFQVQPCPRIVVLDAVQATAVDFFTRTEVWRETLAETLFQGSRHLDLEPDRETAIARVADVFLDGTTLNSGSDYTVRASGRGAHLELLFDADRDRTVYACCVLRPTRTAINLPEILLEEWGEALAHGALVRIKSMSGPNVGWTDPQAAQWNLQLYEEDLSRARVRAIRRRTGRLLLGRNEEDA